MRADAHPLLGGFLMSNERNYDTERLPDTNSSNLAENLDRRNFLKTAVVGSAAVAMTLAGTVGSAGAAENLHARVPAKDLPAQRHRHRQDIRGGSHQRQSPRERRGFR